MYFGVHEWLKPVSSELSETVRPGFLLQAETEHEAKLTLSDYNHIGLMHFENTCARPCRCVRLCKSPEWRADCGICGFPPPRSNHPIVYSHGPPCNNVRFISTLAFVNTDHFKCYLFQNLCRLIC
jgi:hypothetical protein